MTQETKERGRSPLLSLSPSQKIWALTAGLVVATVLLFLSNLTGWDASGRDYYLPWWGMAGLFVLAEMLIVHFQFRRNAQTITMAELALVAGFFFSSPVDMVLGQLVGAALVRLLFQRQTPLKAAFNIAAYTFEATIGAAIFFSLAGAGDAHDPASWGVAFMATFAASITSVLLVGFAISLNEGSFPLRSLAIGMLYGVIATAANTSVALLGVIVFVEQPAAAALLSIPVLVLVAAYRAYVDQTQKRENVEFLYESTRLAQANLQSQVMVKTLLQQAREMARAQVAQLTLFNETEENCGFRTSLGPGDVMTDPVEVELDPKEGVWARVAAEGRAVLLPKPITNDRLRLHFAARNVYKDVMVAPLHGADGVIGTILVGDRLGDVSTFDDEDLKLFETLANHASVALENARLVDRLKESLAHLTEMNSLKDDFVAAVSHELRTPLTSIQGYVKTLLRPGATFEPDVQRSFLEAVDRQSDRLRNLIEDLLVVSQLEAQSVSTSVMPVKLGQVIENVTNELREKLEGRDLTVEVAEGTPVVFSDGGKIFQILSNFVDNAAKYSPPGTSIRVETRIEGEGVTVAVRDSGEGIPLEEQDRIFERFYQVDQSSTRKVGGTGLGLYICRRLAEALHGRVWLETSTGAGSVFALWVPTAPPLPEPKAPQRAPIGQVLN
jgi:signal transduction histidine kinase